MKTNRYINQQSHNEYKARPTFDKHNTIKSQQEKATLKSLLDSYNSQQNYNLSCNKQLGLYITSIFEQNKLNKNKYKSQLMVREGTLKEFLRKYLADPKKAIIFKATTHQHSHQIANSDHQIPKNHFSLCRTTYEGQQDSDKPLHESNRKNNFNNKSGEQLFAKDKWVSGEYKRELADNKKLMTVEEVKESLQSEAQQSEKEQQKKQTNYHFSQVHSNFKFNKNIVKKQQSSNKQMNHQNFQQKMPQIYQIQRKPLQSVANIQFENNKHREQILHPQKILIVQPPTTKIKESQRNSFGLEIRRGLIQNDSFQPAYEHSLRVAGDREIEKELNCRINSNEVSQISELSSIISTGRQEGTNCQPINNSLKNDIAIIDYESRSEVDKKNEQKQNAFCKKQNQYMQPGNTPLQQKVQKMNLRSIAQKRELQMDDNIEITQKQHTAQPEFMVKYNLRFLDKKNQGTEVVRLSPLRFRAKQPITKEVLGYENTPPA